jgi:hypothetical protein
MIKKSASSERLDSVASWPAPNTSVPGNSPATIATSKLHVRPGGDKGHQTTHA